MGACHLISRYVWGWSLRGVALERRMRWAWIEFKKAREDFERDFFP
jgi:hypothetical protein